MAHGTRMHILDARQRLQRVGPALGQRAERPLTQQPITRDVTRTRLALAPGGDDLLHGEVGWIQAPSLLHLLIG